MPKISVCIPEHKGIMYDTIKSVYTQNFLDYEIKPSDGKKGFTDALNKAKDLCNGEIIVFLSSDDILLPGALRYIVNTFDNNPSLAILVRPYYWFLENWEKPIRKTKYKNFGIEDLIFLTGQASGIAVRKKALNYPFSEKRFVEFAGGVLPIIRDYESKIANKPTVAIRIDSSAARSKEVYSESPTENWLSVIKENFNRDFVKYMEKKISNNHIGLIQIKSYGGLRPTLKEIGILLRLNYQNLFNPKFWFYSLGVIIMPSWVLRKLSKWFIYNINQWFVR